MPFYPEDLKRSTVKGEMDMIEGECGLPRGDKLGECGYFIAQPTPADREPGVHLSNVYRRM